MTTSNSSMTWRMTSTGNLNVIIEDEFYQVSNKHPKHKELVDAMRNNDADSFKRTYDQYEMAFLGAETYDIKEKVKIDAETIEYRGQKISDPVLVKIIKNYGTQCDALKRFIDNMFLNPNWESVKQLGSFLQHGNFPLTEDGCFLGYKAVRSDFLDIYSGTVDNSIGKTIQMPRAKVTFDPSLACSAGYHVGTYGYATGYGGGNAIILIVKVNPAHCVSVPYDHNAEKLRCSQYTVVGQCDDVLSMSIVYSTDGRQFKTENYFADIKSEEEYRRRRPAPVPCCDDDEDYEDDWDDDDYDEDDDDNDGKQYVCDNCNWHEDVSTIQDSLGPISWCPKCGSDLEIE